MSDHFYNEGGDLLSKRDIDGKKPEIFICVGNNTAGKTFYWTRYRLKKFLKTGEKTLFVYRWQTELPDCAEKILKDVNGTLNMGLKYHDEPYAGGIARQIFVNDESMGYAVSLNSVAKIKRMSHLFVDAEMIIMDEFQEQYGHYCPYEVDKFVKLHIAIARGNGKASRYLPCVLIGNAVSLLNPYFIALNCAHKLRADTKYLRLKGCVIQHIYNDHAKNEMQKHGFMSAFYGSDISEYVGGVYLNDATFVEKMHGKFEYLCTLKYDGKYYGVRLYPDVIYICDTADLGNPHKIACTVNDVDLDFKRSTQCQSYIGILRDYFNSGKLRFKNLVCKESVFNALY